METEAPQDTELTFGESATFDVAWLNVSKPKVFKPSQYAAKDKAKAYVKFTITLVNKTGATFDPALVYATVQSANSKPAQSTTARTASTVAQAPNCSRAAKPSGRSPSASRTPRTSSWKSILGPSSTLTFFTPTDHYARGYCWHCHGAHIDGLRRNPGARRCASHRNTVIFGVNPLACRTHSARTRLWPRCRGRRTRPGALVRQQLGHGDC